MLNNFNILNLNNNYTHMPFLFSYKGIEYMLYTSARILIDNYMPWETYCINLTNGEQWKINTPQSGNDIQCSPSVFEENDKLIFTHIGSTTNDNGSKFYEFYKLNDFSDLQGNGVYKSQGRMMKGAENKKYIVKHIKQYTFEKGIEERLEFYEKESNALVFEEREELDNIVRVVSVFNSENLFIITSRRNNDYISYILDIESNNRELIQVDGQSVYKCSIYNGVLAYAVKEDGFEERHIEFTENFDLVSI
jgi:hypothetical protein